MSLKYQVENRRHQLLYTRHNRPHRKGGPASIWKNGDQYYFEYGQRHRIGGPAEVWGVNLLQVDYYIRGLRYTWEAYESKIRS